MLPLETTGQILLLVAEIAIITEAKSSTPGTVGPFGRTIESTMAMVLTRMSSAANCSSVVVDVAADSELHPIGCYEPDIHSCMAIIPSSSLCSEEDVRDETMELCDGGIQFSHFTDTPEELKFLPLRDVSRYLVLHINCSARDSRRPRGVKSRKPCKTQGRPGSQVTTRRPEMHTTKAFSTTTDCWTSEEREDYDSHHINSKSMVIGCFCGILATVVVAMIFIKVKARVIKSRQIMADNECDNTETDILPPESPDEWTHAASELSSTRSSRKYYEILDVPPNQNQERDYATIRSHLQLISRRTNSGYEMPMDRRPSAVAIPTIPETIQENVEAEHSYIGQPASVPRYQNWNAHTINLTPK